MTAAHTLLRFGMLAVVSGCTIFRPIQKPSVPDDEARHRAALATVVVHNNTAYALRISYRMATPPMQRVLVGTVPARGRQALPPLPAGEPLILVAQRDDGTEFALDQRSFSIDELWTWVIPVDATFKKQ